MKLGIVGLPNVGKSYPFNDHYTNGRGSGRTANLPSSVYYYRTTVRTSYVRPSVPYRRTDRRTDDGPTYVPYHRNRNRNRNRNPDRYPVRTGWYR